MNTRHEDLEAAVSTVLDRQARALPIPTREWNDVRVVEMTSARERRRRGRSVGGLIAVATATVAAVVLAAVFARDASREIRTDSRPVAGPSARSVPLRAETKRVLLAAADFSIEVGGQRFTGAEPMVVHGDPGSGAWSEYTTLELEWFEHGVEMRLYMYFTSDGEEWWSNEIRTYDGREEGDWIVYTGEFFRMPRGTPFEGDLDVTGSGRDVTGRLRLGNLRLEAFRPPAGCTNPTGSYVLDTTVDELTLAVNPEGGYGVGVTLLDAASCTPVPDSGFVYEWTVADPTVATVTDPDSTDPSSGTGASVQAAGIGETTVHVTARDPESGAALAEADIKVTGVSSAG